MSDPDMLVWQANKMADGVLVISSHHQTGHAEPCDREHNVFHSFSRPCYICLKVCRVSLRLFVKSTGCQWWICRFCLHCQMPIGLHTAVDWAQGPQKNVRQFFLNSVKVYICKFQNWKEKDFKKPFTSILLQ